jgi:hypothetical protein
LINVDHKSNRHYMRHPFQLSLPGPWFDEARAAGNVLPNDHHRAFGARILKNSRKRHTLSVHQRFVALLCAWQRTECNRQNERADDANGNSTYSSHVVLPFHERRVRQPS